VWSAQTFNVSSDGMVFRNGVRERWRAPGGANEHSPVDVRRDVFYERWVDRRVIAALRRLPGARTAEGVVVIDVESSSVSSRGRTRSVVATYSMLRRRRTCSILRAGSSIL